MAALPEPAPVEDHGIVERVIVPLDGSERAERVLSLVVPLACWLGAELTLLHVLAPRPQLPGSGVGIEYPDTLHDRLRSLAGDYLGEVSKSIVQGRVRAKAVTAAGDTPAMVLAHAEQGSLSLIALSTTPRSILRRWFAASVTDAVWARTKVPLLVANPELLPPAGEPYAVPRSVLVPLDGSAHDDVALHYARHLALAGGLDVTLAGPSPGGGRSWLSRRRGFPVTQNGFADDDAAKSYLEAQARELREDAIEVTTILNSWPAVFAHGRANGEPPPHISVIAAGRNLKWIRSVSGSVLSQLLAASAAPLLLVPPGLSPTASRENRRPPL